MACPEGMDTEQAFLAALEKVDRYEIKGQTMAVYGGDEVLARFEAVHLP
jgi:heat shock protein HslJ